MAEQGAPLDGGLFDRTSRLFDAKRQMLPPQAIRDLATEIVRRVSGMAQGSRAEPGAPVPEASLAAFCTLLQQPSADDALQFIRDRQAEGAGRDVLLYSYLAGAARLLGARWEADEAGFLDVIHGTGHLYALLRAIRTDPPAHSPSPFNRRKALFALVPGETHSFGIRLAAETFREAGWDIDLQIDLEHDHLIWHAQHGGAGIIGLSLSTRNRLPDLIRLVVALRLVRPSAIIGVAPALDMEEDDLRAMADIDIIFRDARDAVRDLDRILRLRD